MGLEVTLIQRSARLMGRATASVTSEFFARYHMDRGVKLRLRRYPSAFEGENGRVCAVVLEDGQRIAHATVLMAVGNIHDCGLSRDAGLDSDGGLVWEERRGTSEWR